MKNLKNLMAAMTLLAVLVLGTGSVNAGILVSDFTNQNSDPCAENNDTKQNSGILMGDLVGIIITGMRGGIIITGMKGDTTQVNCGILLGD